MSAHGNPSRSTKIWNHELQKQYSSVPFIYFHDKDPYGQKIFYSICHGRTQFTDSNKFTATPQFIAMGSNTIFESGYFEGNVIPLPDKEKEMIRNKILRYRRSDNPRSVYIANKFQLLLESNSKCSLAFIDADKLFKLIEEFVAEARLADVDFNALPPDGGKYFNKIDMINKFEAERFAWNYNFEECIGVPNQVFNQLSLLINDVNQSSPKMWAVELMRSHIVPPFNQTESTQDIQVHQTFYGKYTVLQYTPTSHIVNTYYLSANNHLGNDEVKEIECLCNRRYQSSTFGHKLQIKFIPIYMDNIKQNQTTKYSGLWAFFNILAFGAGL